MREDFYGAAALLPTSVREHGVRAVREPQSWTW